MINDTAPSPQSPSRFVQQTVASEAYQKAKAKVQVAIDEVRDQLEQSPEIGQLFRTIQNSLNIDPLYGGNRNPVIQVVLDRIVGRISSDQVYRDAFFELDKQIYGYTAILGDMIPQELCAQVVQRQAANAFDKGLNASVKDDWDEYVRRLQTQSYVGYFSTGIASLDDALGGGVHGLTCILGDKGVGKTWLLVNTCLAALLADESTSVLFYSLDAPKKRIMDRIVGRQLGVTYQDLHPKTITEQTLTKVSAIPQSLLQRVRIVERDFTNAQGPDDSFQQRGMTTHLLMQTIRDLQRTSGTSRTLVVIDLFQKMVVPGSVSVTEHDQYRLDVIDEVTQQVRRCRGEGSISFLVASEMRKRHERLKNTVPTMDDIKGDGRIASDADNILLLATIREVDKDINDLVCRVGKGRDGVVRADCELSFNHRRGTFGSREVEPSAKPKSIEMPSSSIDPFAE